MTNAHVRLDTPLTGQILEQEDEVDYPLSRCWAARYPTFQSRQYVQFNCSRIHQAYDTPQPLFPKYAGLAMLVLKIPSRTLVHKELLGCLGSYWWHYSAGDHIGMLRPEIDGQRW